MNNKLFQWKRYETIESSEHHQKTVPENQGGSPYLALLAFAFGGPQEGEEACQEIGDDVRPQWPGSPLFLPRRGGEGIARLCGWVQRRQNQEPEEDSKRPGHLPPGADLNHAALVRTHQGHHLGHRS